MKPRSYMQSKIFILILFCRSPLLLPVRRFDAFDGAVGVEVEAVNTYLAVGAGALLALYVVFVDSVVDDVPLVGSRFLQYRVVGRAVYL